MRKFSCDEEFQNLIGQVLREGASTEGYNVRPKYEDTGEPSHTKYLTNVSMEYNLGEGEFPLLTLRPVAWKSGIKEVMWIYQDQTSSLDILKEKYNIHWWDNWNIGDGTIGKRYGETIREYGQMDYLLDSLKNNPMDRRMILDMFQFNDFELTEGLKPCFFQTIWNVRDGKLDCMLISRSSDSGTALHINLIQYSALLMMLAKSCGLEYGKLTCHIANFHIYDRHFDNVEEMLERKPNNIDKPRLILNVDKGIDFYSIKLEDFEVVDYKPQEKLKEKFVLGV